jgi:hypothetical protein
MDFVAPEPTQAHASARLAAECRASRERVAQAAPARRRSAAAAPDCQILDCRIPDCRVRGCRARAAARPPHASARRARRPPVLAPRSGPDPRPSASPDCPGRCRVARARPRCLHDRLLLRRRARHRHALRIARRRCGHGHRRGIADLAARSAAREIDVNMIVVKSVRAGREHGREALACAGMDGAQKSALLGLAFPSALEIHLAAVGEAEARNVERIAEGVLGDGRPRLAVHGAAGIGGDLLDLDDRRAVPGHGRRLNRLVKPRLDIGDERTGQRRLRLELDKARRSRRRP